MRNKRYFEMECIGIILVPFSIMKLQVSFSPFRPNTCIILELLLQAGAYERSTWNYNSS